jgi:hypothetical protein
MLNFLVDRPVLTIHTPREARPGELVRYDGREPCTVLLPPARSCPGTPVVIVEVLGGEEALTLRPSAGDTVSGLAEFRAGAPPVRGVPFFLWLISDGAHDAIQRGDDPMAAGGNWHVVSSRGARDAG